EDDRGSGESRTAPTELDYVSGRGLNRVDSPGYFFEDFDFDFDFDVEGDFLAVEPDFPAVEPDFLAVEPDFLEESLVALVFPLFLAVVPDFPAPDPDEAAFVEDFDSDGELFFAVPRVLFFFFVFRLGYFSSHSRKNCFTPLTPSRSNASTQPVRNSSASARASASVRFVP
ncbi:MAG: hypothetical protein ACOC2D_01815, partial [Spirochaetota bacterium]